MKWVYSSVQIKHTDRGWQRASPEYCHRNGSKIVKVKVIFVTIIDAAKQNPSHSSLGIFPIGLARKKERVKTAWGLVLRDWTPYQARDCCAPAHPSCTSCSEERGSSWGVFFLFTFLQEKILPYTSSCNSLCRIYILP